MTNLPAPAADGYTVVELDPATDRAEIVDVDEWAFAFHTPPEARELMQFTLQPGRTVGVRHDASGDLVAVHSSFSGTLPVPGGSTPAAGLTWVGVHPGHRRRGIARAMLTTHLRRTAERGEPVSVLFAAEPEIYGRYGYGLAATSFAATLPRGASLAPVPGADRLHCTLERADEQRHLSTLTDVLLRSARPGCFMRDRTDDLRNYFVEVPAWRENAELRRIAIVRDEDGEARAVALFRRTEKWEASGPAGSVQVGLWGAVDGAASHRLFSTLTDLDLMASVKVGAIATDDPLLLQLQNLRTAALRPSDNLWLRIVDLPAALAARTYQVPFEAVLDVADDILPQNAGRWRVAAGPEGARVERVAPDVAADLTLDVATLARAYLGGATLAALAGAGLVGVGSPETLALASVGFASAVAPVCTVDF